MLIKPYMLGPENLLYFAFKYEMYIPFADVVDNQFVDLSFQLFVVKQTQNLVTTVTSSSQTYCHVIASQNKNKHTHK